MTKVDIKKRCAYLLDQFFKHEVIDRELAWAATQRFDIRSKVAAIDSYNKLHKRFETEEEKSKKVIVEFAWQEPEPRLVKTSKK